MSNKIYEKILKKSRDGFLKIKGYKNKKGEYIDFDILDYNNSFIDILKKVCKKSDIPMDMLKDNISNKFKINREGITIDKFLSDTEKNEFESVNFGEKMYGMNLKVEGYYFGEYFIFICKLNFEQDIFKFSKMLDKSNGIYFWVKDIDGHYITVNQKWLDEVGLTDKSMIEGLNSYDVWPKELCEKFKKNENEVIRDNAIKIFEETFPSHEGYKRVDTTIWPLLDDNKNPIGTMGIAIDGKSRASFYENLKENERNFKEITRYCESVFFIRDEEKLLYISPSYETVFEESSEPLEDDVYKFNDCFKNEEHKEGLLENFEFDKLNEGRAKAKLKNGKEKWIGYKFLPIYDEKGQPIKRIGILTDITKDVNLEEEKEKIRLDFFANISHELRTPVNLVLASIEVLKLRLDKLDEDNYEYFSKYINIIQQNGFRLVKLVNNLIDSTRIDSDNMEIRRINEDIIGFIEDTCSSVIDFAKTKNMNLIFDTDSEEEIIAFDPNFVERVMLNLLSNAIKFNKENGNIFVNINVNEKDIIVKVQDEGIGIPDKNIKSIFERFEQVKTKMKSEQEGSGIGLYIAKSLIEMHGGNIEAISKEGKGSTIIFNLPRETVENKEIKNIQNINSKVNEMAIEFSDIYS